jgi:hypothetical protein
MSHWLHSSLLEARVLVEDWGIDYKPSGLHSALGYLTPTEIAEAPGAPTTPHPIH